MYKEASLVRKTANHLNLNWVRKTVYILIVLSIITFFTGFLESTTFEFVIYIFYFILFLGGIKLILVTFQSKTTRVSKVFLLLTGFALTIYFLFFIFASTNNFLFGLDLTEIMESLEDILYLASLFVLIGFIGSLISLRKN
jgi:hypothetical protein